MRRLSHPLKGTMMMAFNSCAIFGIDLAYFHCAGSETRLEVCIHGQVVPWAAVKQMPCLQTRPPDAFQLADLIWCSACSKRLPMPSKRRRKCLRDCQMRAAKRPSCSQSFRTLLQITCNSFSSPEERRLICSFVAGSMLFKNS